MSTTDRVACAQGHTVRLYWLGGVGEYAPLGAGGLDGEQTYKRKKNDEYLDPTKLVAQRLHLLYELSRPLDLTLCQINERARRGLRIEVPPFLLALETE